jgi:hypothetical protein
MITCIDLFGGFNHVIDGKKVMVKIELVSSKSSPNDVFTEDLQSNRHPTIQNHFIIVLPTLNSR